MAFNEQNAFVELYPFLTISIIFFAHATYLWCNL